MAGQAPRGYRVDAQHRRLSRPGGHRHRPDEGDLHRRGPRTIQTANWFPKVIRKDYTVGANISETAVDDPDQMFYENYACGSDRNYTGFCDKQVDALIDRQSSEADPEKQLVWEIERVLARDASRPIIFYTRVATCWHPRVKGLTIVANSVFNGWRFEDVWLDR
jgi:peptide/nickel transport system substrate-binding protein